MISPTFYADCKSKVASITYEALVRGYSNVRDASMRYMREWDKTDKRKEQHKRWSMTEAGRKSMRERSRRYAKAHPDVKRRNSIAYYARHKKEKGFTIKRREWNRSFRDRFSDLHGFSYSYYRNHIKMGDFLTEDIKSTKSNSTFSVQGTEQRAYLIVTGEAATKAKVMKEVDRIRTGGGTFAEVKWTAKMLASTY